MATSRSTATKRPTAARRPDTRARAESWSPLAKVPEKFHTPIFIGLVLLTLLVFFGGVIFGGKVFASGDNISWQSFVPYLDRMADAGEHPFWLPYIFGGMPGYAAYLVTGDRWWDLSMKAMSIAEHTVGMGNFFTIRIILHYFLYGLGMFLWMRGRKLSRSAATYTAIAAMFSTWVIVYIMIGHNTKISVLMTVPYIFLCVDRLLDRWSLMYAALLILAVHLLAEQNHLQTGLYGMMAVGIYVLFELIGSFVGKHKRAIAGPLRAIVVLAIAAGCAYAMGYDRFAAVQEYNPYSTRSSHDYEYSTSWSFSPEESITFLVPSYFGYGELDYKQSANDEVVKLPTYWGQMGNTDAGHYAGICVLLLGILGLWANRGSRFAWAIVAIGAFGLILSFGKNLPVLYNLLYYNLPKFSQFRAPSQSLVMLEFAIPILAGLGVQSIFAMRSAEGAAVGSKRVLRLLFAFGGLMIFGFIIVTASKSSYYAAIGPLANGLAGFLAQQKVQASPAQVQDFIYKTMQTDWIFSILFGCAMLVAVYFYAKGRLSTTACLAIVFVLTITDLWRTDWRPMRPVPMEAAMAVFQPTRVDAHMLHDSIPHRMFDLRINFRVTEDDLLQPKPNYPARQLHEHIGGYQSAKMKIFQDLLNATNGATTAPMSVFTWNLLNTKYLVAPTADVAGLSDALKAGTLHARVVDSTEDGRTFLLENLDALPRAWFVNRVETLDEATTLNRIRDGAFDPRDVAYVTTALKEPVEPVGYIASKPIADTTVLDSTGAPSTPHAGNAANGMVSYSNYTPNHFAINVEAPGRNFLVISEMYYPSWQATIDGKPAEIVRTNYVLRGLVVPPGKHVIEMRYESAGFQTGKTLSLAINGAVLALIAVGFVLERRRRGTPPAPASVPPPAPAPEAQAGDSAV